MNMTLDFESYSECDLHSAGAWKYWKHPSTEPLMLACTWDGGQCIWLPGQSIPAPLLKAIEEGWTFDCHNAAFEQAAWRWMVKHLGWPELPPYRWDDTMARCAALALPLPLDEVGRVLHLPVQKDPAGKKWLKDYTRPTKATKKRPSVRLIPDAEQQQVGVNYCLTDSKSEHGLRKRIGWLQANERNIWLLDQKINQRGVQVDVQQVHAAKEIVRQVEEKLTAELQGLTKGEVSSHNQVDAMLGWFRRNGCELEDLTADTVQAARTSGVWKGTPVQRALEIRQTLAKASTKKLNAFLKAVCADGRVRYMFQYAGATQTKRWAGRLINLQNLPRPTKELEGYDPAALAAMISTGSAEDLEMVYGDAMAAIATGLRGILIPAPGKKFIASDLSSIEAVGLAGLAGEERKLDVFRRKEDPYCAFASFALGFPVTKKTHPRERQEVGKPGELAFGYGGGVGAWRNFDDSPRFTDDEVNDFKISWRDMHPETVKLWGGLEAAAFKALREGYGEYNGVIYKRAGQWLTCVLPSGGTINYFDPQIKEKKAPWSTPERPVWIPVITYMSKKAGKWRRVDTWGGKLAENITQAACRDVLAVGMLRADAQNLPIVLHVHDEIVIEVDEDDTTSEALLIEAMTETQPWYAHWPVRAEAWEGDRYHK